VLPILLIIAASASASTASANLMAAAAASGRPPECLPARSDKLTRRASVWALARAPKRARYCHLIGRAHARLKGKPREARKLARKAELLLPDRAAPHVVVGRAELALGFPEAAVTAFDKALALERFALEQPLTMHDLAQARFQAGKPKKALETYRILVPRANMLPTRTHRARVLLEAAHMSMTVAGQKATSTNNQADLDEALAYLREGARDRHQVLRTDVALSLVLVLDRAGRRAQADALLSELRAAGAWARRAKPSYLGNADDLLAMQAIALEASDKVAAAKKYRAFLASAGGKGPWQKSAQARLTRLGKATTKKPKRRRGRPR